MSKVVASCRIHIDVNRLLNGKGCWSKPGCISINLSPVKPPNIIYHTWRPDKKGRRNLGMMMMMMMMMMKNILNKPTKQKCLIKQALPRKQHKRKKKNDTSTQSQLNSAIQHTFNNRVTIASGHERRHDSSEPKPTWWDHVLRSSQSNSQRQKKSLPRKPNLEI